MFERKVKPVYQAPVPEPKDPGPLYKVVYLTSGPEGAVQMNMVADTGYRFLDWFDDKWERLGYTAETSQRRAIYIKTP